MSDETDFGGIQARRLDVMENFRDETIGHFVEIGKSIALQKNRPINKVHHFVRFASFFSSIFSSFFFVLPGSFRTLENRDERRPIRARDTFSPDAGPLRCRRGHERK